MKPTALIADDEPLLAADLEVRITRLWPELAIVAVCSDGPSALSRLAEEKPDVAFLDIRMPGLTGLQVAQQLDFPCHVIFVTAYDEYAVEAFENAALDYVLKPATDERLRKTIERLKGTVGGWPDMAGMTRVVTALLREQSARPPALKWVRASMGDTVRLIAVSEVAYFQATDKYTLVATGGSDLLIRMPIKNLAEQLDPEVFWRVHRGTLVNIRHVVHARNDESGRVFLTLSGRSEKLAVSRSYTHLFRQM